MARFLDTVLAGWLIAGTVDPRGGYSISGIIRDTRRQPIRAARVEVIAPGFEGRFVVSGGTGRYRIHDLSGGVQLQVSRDGYFSDVRAVAPADDSVVDFVLQPLHRIGIGEAIRGVLTTDHPTCFGQDYEDTGPNSRVVLCHRLLVTAAASGTLEVVLTWDRSNTLALDLIAPDGRSIQSWGGVGRTELRITVHKGSTYEVRVLSQVSTRNSQLSTSRDKATLSAYQDFELRTALK